MYSGHVTVLSESEGLGEDIRDMNETDHVSLDTGVTLTKENCDIKSETNHLKSIFSFYDFPHVSVRERKREGSRD